MSSLPTEILTEIIAFAATYRPSVLPACSLVSHVFLYIARRHLWLKIRLHSHGRSADEVLGWFQRNLELGPLVKSVDIFGNVFSESVPIHVLLESLINVDSLTFAYSDLDELGLSHCCFPRNMRHLKLNCCLTFPSDLQIMAANVRHLSLYGGIICQTPNESCIFPHVEALSILATASSIEAVDPFFSWLGTRISISFPLLTSLNISVGIRDFKELERVFSSLARSLEELVWHFPPQLKFIPLPLSLVPLTGLKRIHVVAYYDHLCSVCHTLETLNSPLLRNVEIITAPQILLDEVPQAWAGLASRLSSTYCPQLETLRVILRGNCRSRRTTDPGFIACVTATLLKPLLQRGCCFIKCSVTNICPVIITDTAQCTKYTIQSGKRMIYLSGDIHSRRLAVKVILPSRSQSNTELLIHKPLMFSYRISVLWSNYYGDSDDAIEM